MAVACKPGRWLACRQLPHRRMRLRCSPCTARLASQGAAEHADLLIVQLTQAVRKNTWTYRAEPRGPEMDAWRQAAAT